MIVHSISTVPTSYRFESDMVIEHCKRISYNLSLVIECVLLI